MARKIDTYTIDGLQFRSKQLGAIDGRRLLSLMIPVVSPALQKLDISDLSKAEGSKMLALFATLMENLTPELTDALCDSFANQTELNLQGRWLAFGPLFEDEMAGRYMTMIKWLAHNLKFNYFDFLGPRAPIAGVDIAAQ